MGKKFKVKCSDLGKIHFSFYDFLLGHHEELNMATNLAIDDKLIIEAQAIGGKKTKKAAVTEALEEYIQRRKQLQLTSLFGKIEYDPKYDYKKSRTRK